MQVLAGHLDDDVEVDLQVVADALGDAEGVFFLALPPPLQLGPEQDGGYEEDDDGPFAAARCAGYVLGFRLGCLDWEERRERVSQLIYLAFRIVVMVRGV